jgi:drug/metabolite transporter (DMT)-like permease
VAYRANAGSGSNRRTLVIRDAPLLVALWLAQMVSLGWRENLLQAVLQGVLAGPAALYLFVTSIALIGAGRAAIFFSLVPPFVLLIGWLALGEVPTVLQLVGLIIVLVGFQLTQKGQTS